VNVFVLCTGRSGSTTFIKACNHITNHTAAHESLSDKVGAARFDFPANHIEADNRLCWQLGELDKIYGQNAFYIHLKRDKEATAKSFMNRFLRPKSMIYAYANGIKKSPPESLSDEEKHNICLDYVDTVNQNIEFFLKDKPHWMSMHIENIKDEFPLFWKAIKAEGDLNKALSEFDIRHNKSASTKVDVKYNLKHFVLKLKMLMD
jgi:hypothetical protein